jgi:hypothetical protein
MNLIYWISVAGVVKDAVKVLLKQVIDSVMKHYF